MEYILLDTNVWRSTALLRGIMGRALISHLQLSGRRILLPEIVEREVIETVTRHLITRCDEIDARSNELDEYDTDVFDNEFYLPSEAEIRQSIIKRLRELSPLAVKRPLTLKQTRGALEMVIRHDPPNINRREEFRDSMIWQSALDAAADCVVHFITSDRAFFENEDPKKPVAAVLAAMAQGRGVKVKVYSALEYYLTSTLRSSLAMREEEYTRQLREWLNPHAAKVLEEICAGSSLYTGAEYVPVPSGNPKSITVRFNLSYESQEVAAQSRDKGICGGGIVLKGAAWFEKADGKLRKAELTEEDRHTVDSSGTRHDLCGVLYIKKKRRTKEPSVPGTSVTPPAGQEPRR
jgi:hypothetical protein